MPGPVILLILGLVGLWFGAELTIRAALNIAEHYKLSHLFIGLTILALGTDLPELFIDTAGAIQRLAGVETSGLIVGETIGTCFAQIGLVLGIIGLFCTLTITKRQLVRDGFMMVGSVVLLFLVGLDGKISRVDGILFMVVYIFYFLSLFREEKVREKIHRAPKLHPFWAVFSLIVGFALLGYFSNMTVQNGVLVGQIWGISQSLIGIVILGLGTSLPELSVSIAAIRNGATKMAVGNLIGSNIFDMLFTLGFASAISGFVINEALLNFDIPALLGMSLIVLFLFRTRMRLCKKEAIVLLLFFFAYIGFKLSGIQV
jgi:cation:H+ antiporter